MNMFTTAQHPQTVALPVRLQGRPEKEMSISAQLRNVLLSKEEGKSFARVMSGLYRTKHKVAISSLPSFIQEMIPNLIQLDLVQSQGDRVWLTLLGRHVCSWAKEFVHWLDADKKVQSILPVGMSLKGKRFLDCGCGSGRYVTAAMQDGAVGFGIDPQPLCLELLQILCEREGIHVPTLKLGKSEDIPFGDESFDVVFSRISLQYSMVLQTLDEWRRVAAPKCLVVLKFTNFANSFHELNLVSMFDLVNTLLLMSTGHQASFPRKGGMEQVHCSTYPTVGWMCRQFEKRNFKILNVSPDKGEILAQKT